MIEKSVVIVGGGIAGLAVARTLADNGVRCTVVERDPGLGGHVGNWACMATDRCARCFCCSVEDLVASVRASDRIDVLTGWELSSIVASDGGKQVSMQRTATREERVADAAAVVLATGFEPYDPREKVFWGHGRLSGVYTLSEVDAMVREDALSQFAGCGSQLEVAFFQCVGSRDAASGANYCSQYCCKAALRMALKLLHDCPKLSVTVFYIDLQLAGKYAGELLRTAKDKNVRFRQGVPGEILDAGESLEVIVESDGRNQRERFDRVILSIGQRPNHLQGLSEPLGIPANEHGFMESKGALDSSRTVIPGIYLAGTCAGPKDIESTLEHAGQTAEAIIADLRRGQL